MDISQLIAPDRVKCLSGIGSKKRALESLSNLLGAGAIGVDPTMIFHQLVERERLGSTGLGHGVALPHGRLATSPLDEPSTEIPASGYTLGSFIKLDKGIDFDSPDAQPADLLFGLLVPENCTDEHLQILAALAGMFSDTQLCNELRACTSDEELYSHLANWAHKHQAAS